MTTNLSNEEKKLLDEAEDYFQRKMIWLLKNGYTDGDVMENEDGLEYVYEGIKTGIPGERIYLNEVLKQK